jgi:hypothetical protein
MPPSKGHLIDSKVNGNSVDLNISEITILNMINKLLKGCSNAGEAFVRAFSKSINPPEGFAPAPFEDFISWLPPKG